jgi:hypothetical protein
MMDNGVSPAAVLWHFTKNQCQLHYLNSTTGGNTAVSAQVVTDTYRVHIFGVA